MTAQPLLQFRTVALNPALDCRVVRFQAALVEQFFDITERERLPQVPAHSAKNQLGLGLSPLEDRRSDCLFHDRFRLQAAIDQSCNTTLWRMDAGQHGLESEAALQSLPATRIADRRSGFQILLPVEKTPLRMSAPARKCRITVFLDTSSPNRPANVQSSIRRRSIGALKSDSLLERSPCFESARLRSRPRPTRALENCQMGVCVNLPGFSGDSFS